MHAHGPTFTARLHPRAENKKPCTFVKAMIAFILAAIFLVVAIVFFYIGPLERFVRSLLIVVLGTWAIVTL